MALYRNERIPDYEFTADLKRVDENLYVVFDSLSMRWDIFFKAKDNRVYLVYRVCEKSANGRDAGYMPLDKRTIDKLLRMDLSRKNMSPIEYAQLVNKADQDREEKLIAKHESDTDYIYREEHVTLERMRDALRGVFRRPLL